MRIFNFRYIFHCQKFIFSNVLVSFVCLVPCLNVHVSCLFLNTLKMYSYVFQHLIIPVSKGHILSSVVSDSAQSACLIFLFVL